MYYYINRIFRCTIETTQQQIVDAFKTFTARDDIAVLLISQNVRSRIDGK
jgi:vacuolar-type H+-ATPase subunit F/Vma7